MPEELQDRVLSALLLAIRPLARALLNAGVGYKEFAEVAKLAFVQTATEDYGIRGRPTNVSRVSVITGISRKEVGKLRSSDSFLPTGFIRGTPAGELLHRWHTDERFTQGDGQPLDLPIGGSDISFVSLVKDVGGDIPPGAMKAELLRVNAIEELDSGLIRAIKRHYVPARVDDKLLHGLDTAIRYLTDTVAYNTSPSRLDEPRFERVVSAVNIPAEKFEDIRRASKKHLEKYTVEYDDYLSGIEKSSQIDDIKTEVGIGFYYFETTDKS